MLRLSTNRLPAAHALSPATSPSKEGLIYVVDDHDTAREGLQALLESVGYTVKTFDSATALLKEPLAGTPSCIISDVRLPGPSGLQLQQELMDRGYRIPVIFITGYADVRMSVQAMKSGAIEFLVKPFREQELLDATRFALERDQARLGAEAQQQGLQRLFESLRDREREVLRLVIAGLLNKQIAHSLGLSEPTVKVYRHNLMRKLGARSVAELVRFGHSLGLDS
jgi:RNA polymerase sigma factor (sigma-70 family)